MDELTGLPTHLDLPGALAELPRDDASAGLTAILFDVDGMIWINHERGHLEGDAVLARIGRWLESRAQQVQGQAFRVAHMGHVNAPMILGTLSVIEVALNALQIPHGKGGTTAAIEWLGESVSA